MLDFMRVVVQACEAVIVGRDWSNAFRMCGFTLHGASELQCTVDIKERLGIGATIEPMLDQEVVNTCMPRNRWLPHVAFDPGVRSTLPMLKALFPFSERYQGCDGSAWRLELSEA